MTYEISQAQILGIRCINFDLSKAHATLRFTYTTIQCILDQRTDDATRRTPGSRPERYEGLAAGGGEEGKGVEVLLRTNPVNATVSAAQPYGMGGADRGSEFDRGHQVERRFHLRVVYPVLRAASRRGCERSPLKLARDSRYAGSLTCASRRRQPWAHVDGALMSMMRPGVSCSEC